MAIQVRKGVKTTPSLDLIYGFEGVGKSSLGATYPAPLFLDTEGSTSDLDVHAIEVKDYASFVEAMQFACQSNEYKSIVIDTVDWLDQMVIENILREDNATSITDSKLYGFGAGDKRIQGYWYKNIIPMFKAVLKSGKNLVMLGHAEVKGQDDPLNGRFDKYKLKMSKLSSSIVKEYVRNMFFMTFETHIEYRKGLEKNKLKGGRIRNIHTVHTPQYEAKCRTKGIPETMVFIEGINPYNDFIGTNIMNQSKEVSIGAFKKIEKDLIDSLNECKDINEIGKIWKANAVIHKSEDAIKLFGEYKAKLNQLKEDK